MIKPPGEIVSKGLIIILLLSVSTSKLCIAPIKTVLRVGTSNNTLIEGFPVSSSLTSSVQSSDNSFYFYNLSYYRFSSSVTEFNNILEFLVTKRKIEHYFLLNPFCSANNAPILNNSHSTSKVFTKSVRTLEGDKTDLTDIISTPFTYILGTVVIPRGGISSQVSVRYVYNTNPKKGWNTDIIFEDAEWLEGRTPIGYGNYLIRTKISFKDLYIRKVFPILKVPRNVILSIASDDGAEVWINGEKVLNDQDSLHSSWYWNYRLNITSYLKIGENLLAVHIKNSGGDCHFDFELVLQEDKLDEILFNYVKGRLNPDGGFSDDHLEETFYATSILKILDSINVIDQKKVAFWILSHKFVHGDFGNWVAWQYPAVESLKNLGLELDSESAERLITVLINWRSSDGSWGGNLLNTWQAVEALASLNALNRVRDWEKTVNFIKSLQRNDGGFSNRRGETTYLRFTFYAIRSLQLLNALNSIDKNKATSFIKSCYKNGAFSDRPGWEEGIDSTYWGVRSLEVLNSLYEIDSEKIAKKVVSWLGDKGSTGYLRSDYYVVTILKVLDKLSLLNKMKILSNVMNFYNNISGGFKHESRLYNTAHALKILSSIGMLNKLETKKIEQWVLAQPFYDGSTSDIHSAVYCLKELAALHKVDVKKVVDELLKHQLPEGGFRAREDGGEANLWETYLAMKTLYILNKTSLFNKEKVVNFVISLRNPDGSFRYSRSETRYDTATPLALIILNMLGESHRIEEQTINWIKKSQREDGGFGGILQTYLSLRALRCLGKLDSTSLAKAIKYTLSLQNLDGGFGVASADMWSWLEFTSYATNILKTFVHGGGHSYFIRVSSPYGTPLGEGWYTNGSTAIISIDRVVIDHGNATRRIFKGWYEGNVIVSVLPSFQLTIDKPRNITAVWDTEYEVKVYSERGVITGSGWYKPGDLAQISISPIRCEGLIIDNIFEGWKISGKVVSTSPTYSFIVDKPVTLTGSWKTELKVANLVLLIGAPIGVFTVLAALHYGRRRERIEETAIDEKMRMVKELLKKIEEET